MSEQITITVASIPQREAGLQDVVQKLLPQCDRMFVCLNDYPYIPRFLVHKKVEYAQLLGEKTVSDHGKFLWNDQITEGYHFTVDDDIFYPKDYVQHTVDIIEHYRRRAVVGYHGTDLLLRAGKLFTLGNIKVSIKRLRFGDPLEADRRVYMLGTGVLAYHTQTMHYAYKDLQPGGTDEQIALHCQTHNIPMVCLKHARGWLVDNGRMSCQQNIGGNKRLDGIALRRIRGYTQWHLPPLG